MTADVDDARRGWFGRLVGYAIVSFFASFALELVIVPVVYALEESWQDGLRAWGEMMTALIDGEPVAWFFLGIPAAVVTMVQLVFLLPLFRPPQTSDRATSLKKSAVAAGFVGAALTAGVAWAALEAVSLEGEAVEKFGPTVFFGTALAAFVPGWFAWTWVLLRRSDRADPLGLDRMLLPLVVGTGISMAIIVPLDAIVRRRRDCYCETGTFFAMGLGIASAVWLLGPCALLAVSRDRRRWARRRNCLRCGYPRVRGMGPNCPECGRAWTARGRGT